MRVFADEPNNKLKVKKKGIWSKNQRVARNCELRARSLDFTRYSNSKFKHFFLRLLGVTKEQLGCIAFNRFFSKSTWWNNVGAYQCTVGHYLLFMLKTLNFSNCCALLFHFFVNFRFKIALRKAFAPQLSKFSSESNVRVNTSHVYECGSCSLYISLVIFLL